jgi:hypothetical protein
MRNRKEPRFINYRKQGLVERLARPNYERNVWYFPALLCMGLFFIFFLRDIMHRSTSFDWSHSSVIHPVALDSDKATGNHVPEEMVVRPNQTNADGA